VPLTLVQSKSAVTATAQVALLAVFDASPTSGNLLLAAANADATLTMTSSGWTLAASVINFTGLYHWWKIAGALESSTVTVTPSGTATVELYIAEYSGNDPSPLDQTATSNPGSNASTIASGTTSATTQADELAIAAFGWNDSPGTAGLASSVSNGFALDANLRGTDPTSMDTWLAVASKALVATGAQTTTATLAGTAGRPVGLIATYKSSGVTVHERSAAISGTGAIATVGQRTLVRQVAVAGAGAIAVSAVFWSILERSAAIAGVGDIQAVGQRDLLRSATITGVGVIATSRQLVLNRAVAIAGVGAISVAGGTVGAVGHLESSGGSRTLIE
jgi:hypothetical protein